MSGDDADAPGGRASGPDDGPAGDRPTGDPPPGDRPADDRPADDRPAGDRPAGDRPADDGPGGEGPGGEGRDGAGPGGRPRVHAPVRELLRGIALTPLDPGYHAVHGRPSGARRLSTSAVVVLVLGVLGAVAAAGVAQLRDVPSGSSGRLVLEDEIDRRTTIADEITVANQERRSRIASLENSALSRDDVVLARTVERLGLASGAVAVRGPGVRVVLDDPESVDGELFGDERESTDADRVLDLDIQLVVNGLWAAGADAVAVNGQRLTSLSAIRNAGPAILVEYRPLVPPYVVEAIGDGEAMSEEMTSPTSATGSVLAVVRTNYGVRVSTEVVDELALPPSSTLLLDHAEPVRSGTPWPTGSDTPSDEPDEGST